MSKRQEVQKEIILNSHGVLHGIAKEKRIQPEGQEIIDLVALLEEYLFDDYYHESGGITTSNFSVRFEDWLNNFETLEQSLEAYKSLISLFFVGEKEMLALWRHAYETIIPRWLICKENFSIVDDSLSEKVSQVLDNSLLIPVSDGFDLKKFMSVFKIYANDFKFDILNTVNELDEDGQDALVKSLIDIISNKEISKILLFEDFVGSGTQIEKSLKFVRKALDSIDKEIDVLVVPMLICPKGAKACIEYEKKYGVDIKWVTEVSENCFISKTVSEESPHHYLYQLAKSMHLSLLGNQVDNENEVTEYPYSPLGFKSTGGMIVMYSNAPNNTLPLYHFASQYSDWKPLFPRRRSQWERNQSIKIGEPCED